MTKKQYEELGSFVKAVHLEDCIANALGYDGLGKALLLAMSVDDIIDNLEYIARCHEVEIYEEND